MIVSTEWPYQQHNMYKSKQDFHQKRTSIIKSEVGAVAKV